MLSCRSVSLKGNIITFIITIGSLLFYAFMLYLFFIFYILYFLLLLCIYIFICYCVNTYVKLYILGVV